MFGSPAPAAKKAFGTEPISVKALLITQRKVHFKHFHSPVLPEEAKSITLRL